MNIRELAELFDKQRKWREQPQYRSGQKRRAEKALNREVDELELTEIIEDNYFKGNWDRKEVR